MGTAVYSQATIVGLKTISQDGLKMLFMEFQSMVKYGFMHTDQAHQRKSLFSAIGHFLEHVLSVSTVTQCSSFKYVSYPFPKCQSSVPNVDKSSMSIHALFLDGPNLQNIRMKIRKREVEGT